MNFSYRKDLSKCAKCGGFWIDVAGLAKLQSMNGQQKQKALRNYFSVIFDKKILGINVINEDVAKAVKNIIQIFQFLCPKDDFPEEGNELGR